MWLICLFFPEKNRKLRKVHNTGNKNFVFLFYFQIFFEALLKSFERHACRHARSPWCLMSSDRQARADIYPA